MHLYSMAISPRMLSLIPKGNFNHHFKINHHLIKIKKSKNLLQNLWQSWRSNGKKSLTHPLFSIAKLNLKVYLPNVMSKYRIILADDHVILRAGVKRIIQEDPELTVVGEAGDGLELLHLLEESTPDMVILDISMPRLRGLEAIRIIKGLNPEVKVLILTMHKNKDYLYKAMDNGADGYLLKEEPPESFYSAIESIRKGKTYTSPLLFG